LIRTLGNYLGRVPLGSGGVYIRLLIRLGRGISLIFTIADGVGVLADLRRMMLWRG
jgi:hypothetical protein